MNIKTFIYSTAVVALSTFTLSVPAAGELKFDIPAPNSIVLEGDELKYEAIFMKLLGETEKLLAMLDGVKDKEGADAAVPKVEKFVVNLNKAIKMMEDLKLSKDSQDKVIMKHLGDFIMLAVKYGEAPSERIKKNDYYGSEKLKTICEKLEKEASILLNKDKTAFYMCAEPTLVCSGKALLSYPSETQGCGCK